RRARARARRLRRSEASCGGCAPARAALAVRGSAKRRVERVACAREYVVHRRGRTARLLAVVVRGVRHVVAERAILGTATRIVAADDALVRAAFLPALKLGRTRRVERMRAEDDVEHLEQSVDRVPTALVLLGLDEKLIEARFIVA